MPNFEQEKPQSPEAVQPQQQETDPRYNQPVDAYHLSDIAEHYQDFFGWKEKTTGDIYAADKSRQMSEIYSILQSYANHAPQESTGADMIKSLNNLLESKKQSIQTADEKRKPRLQKEVDDIRATITFSSARIIQPITPDQLAKMNQNLIQEQAKVLAPMVKKNPSTEAPVILTASQPETQPTIIAPPVTENQTGNTEQEQKERRLIDQVLAKCGARINFDMPNGFGDGGGAGGFKIKSDEKIIASDDGGFSGIRGRMIANLDTAVNFDGYQTSPSRREERSNLRVNSPADYMAAKGISEFVYIEPVTESTYEQRTKMVDEETSGFMGFGKKVIQVPKTESVKVGERPVVTREKIANGDNEPCYRLVYTLTPSDEQKEEYKTVQGSRGGQTCDIEMFIPQGQAHAILRAVRHDPTFMHRLVGEIAVKDLNIPEEWWDKGWEGRNSPVKPPYEKWREMSGGKSRMYVVEKSEIQDQINQGTNEFDQKFVKEY